MTQISFDDMKEDSFFLQASRNRANFRNFILDIEDKSWITICRKLYQRIRIISNSIKFGVHDALLQESYVKSYWNRKVSERLTYEKKDNSEFSFERGWEKDASLMKNINVRRAAADPINFVTKRSEKSKYKDCSDTRFLVSRHAEQQHILITKKSVLNYIKIRVYESSKQQRCMES